MKKWSVEGLAHSGITVKNLQDSLDFYMNKLNFKLLKKQTNDKDYIHDIVEIPGLKKIEIAFLEMPDKSIIELLEYVGVDTYSGASRSCDYGTGHICLRIKNLNNMFEELSKQGVEFISENIAHINAGSNKGAKAVYMKDPDGYIIELMGN